MKIDLYEEMKKAIKDALTEWYSENKNFIQKKPILDEKGSNLLTVEQFCSKHQFISEAGLRGKLNFRDYNRLNQCISKSGRRVLIKEKETLEWFSNPPPEHNWTYDRKKYDRD